MLAVEDHTRIHHFFQTLAKNRRNRKKTEIFGAAAKPRYPPAGGVVTHVTSKLVIVTYVTSIITFSFVYTRSARARSGRLFCSRSAPLFSRAAHRDRVNAWTMTRNGTLTWSMNDVVHECIAALSLKCPVCSSTVWSYSMEAHFSSRLNSHGVMPAEPSAEVALKPHERFLTSQLIKNNKAKKFTCNDASCNCTFKD